MPQRPVLVTGFQPYGGRGLNPAHEAMRAMDGRVIEGVAVVGRGLSVSFATLQREIAELLDEVDPAAVVSIGLWPGEATIRVERIGCNIADFEIADNDGYKVMDGEVLGNDAAARLSTLPVRAIEQAMLEAGIPARLSSTAGTFLCNACLYSFLSAAEARARRTLCGFVHVPYIPEQVAEMLASVRKAARLESHQRADVASMELTRIVSAIEIAVAVTARSLSGTA